MAMTPLRILITDDLAYNRMILQQALSDLLPSANIQLAENGLIALDKIKQNAKENIFFQLIFMDFCMPFLSGTDTVSQIRSFEKTIHQQSFIMTWSSSKTKPLPLTDDWLPKPFLIEELKQRLCLHQFI